LDYRTGILATRALREGETAFLAVAERCPDFDPDALAEFARRQNLREWFTPLAESERARALLRAPFVAELEQVRAAQPEEKRALIALCAEVQAALGAAGVPCLFLKGLYLGQRFYGDVHRRHQYDVDVLVRPADRIAALAALTALGMRVTEGDASRLPRWHKGSRKREVQALALRDRNGRKLDLHAHTKSDWFAGIDETAYWAERRSFTVAGHELDTLSDHHTLLLLIASLCADVLRSAVRAKHFLDLYLVLRGLGPGFDWERFLAERRRERLLKTSVNALALLLLLWDCAEEFPELARAVERRRRWVEVASAREAVELVTRPRYSPENLVWYERLGARSPRAYWRFRLLRDLPHTLRRALP
jgi:hypothetical protein